MGHERGGDAALKDCGEAGTRLEKRGANCDAPPDSGPERQEWSQDTQATRCCFRLATVRLARWTQRQHDGLETPVNPAWLTLGNPYSLQQCKKTHVRMMASNPPWRAAPTVTCTLDNFLTTEALSGRGGRGQSGGSAWKTVD
ncbi:hypothetical protein CapIbe_021140 [Capra ibex]